MGSRGPCSRSNTLALGVSVCCSSFLQSNTNQRDLNVQEAWQQGYTGRGVVVSILDDGIEKNHPDLEANYVSGGEDGRAGQRPPGAPAVSHWRAHTSKSPRPRHRGMGLSLSGQQAGLQDDRHPGLL